MSCQHIEVFHRICVRYWFESLLFWPKNVTRKLVVKNTKVRKIHYGGVIWTFFDASEQEETAIHNMLNEGGYEEGNQHLETAVIIYQDNAIVFRITMPFCGDCDGRETLSQIRLLSSKVGNWMWRDTFNEFLNRY